MNREATEHISIKGIRDGLLITLDTYPAYDTIREELAAEIIEKGDFLRDSRVVLAVGARRLDQAQLAEIQTLFAEHGMGLWAVLSKREPTREAARGLGLATRLPGSQMDLEGNGRPEPEAAPEEKKPGRPPNALLIKETLRSGRAIYYEGNIVIYGDVNPGAEVVADGDVMVWGKLRGLVHAGATGRTDAQVSALDLSPIQLRIADHIAITPQNKREQVQPETAVIRDGQIVAEPWT